MSPDQAGPLSKAAYYIATKWPTETRHSGSPQCCPDGMQPDLGLDCEGHKNKAEVGPPTMGDSRSTTRNATCELLAWTLIENEQL